LKAIDLREESQHAQVSKPKGSKSSSKFCSQQCQRYGNWKFFNPAASATETFEFSVECSQQPLQLNPAKQNSHPIASVEAVRNNATNLRRYRGKKLPMEPHPEAMQESEKAVPAAGAG
jgi:hypothetical protein